MKVYVITKAEILCPEVYVTVKGSKKDAEKFIRAKFPNARKENGNGYDSFLCKAGSHESLMFVHEEEI